MRKLILLAAAAAAAALLAGPTLAQTETAPTAPAAAAAPTQTDIEATAAAFQADLEAMARELDAAKAAAGTDAAKGDAEADAIVARHQPVADAFADQLTAFIATQPLPPEAQVQVAAAVEKIRGAPAEIRARHTAASTARAVPAAE